MDANTREQAGLLQRLGQHDSDLAAQVQAVLASAKAASQAQFLDGPAAYTAMVPTLAGLRLGAYTLDEPIAEGGAGQVWLAHRHDGHFEARVAVKLLHHGSTSPVFTERFKREGHILAQLRHAHIAQLLDVGVSDSGQHYLVLEHVVGQHIDLACDARCLGVRQRLALFLNLLDAVQTAHQHLVVHRDIKPGNVLMGEAGGVKLLDFGIAKMLDGQGQGATVTAMAGAMLTPGYAAPEQWQGLPVTAATDVYALGVLLYVLLAGRHPTLTDSATMAQTMQATLQGQAPRLSAVSVSNELAAKRGCPSALELTRQLRGDLDRVVAKAMHPDAPQRYANAAAFADDLRRYLGHRPVRATPPSWGYVAGKFSRRQRVPLAVGVVAAVALLGLGRHTLDQRSQAQTNQSRAATVDGLLRSMFRGMSPDLASQRRFTAEELVGRAQSYLENSSGLDPATKRQVQVKIAQAYVEVGAYELALRTLKAETAEAQAQGDVPGQRAGALGQADIYLRQHQVEPANEQISRFEALLERAPAADQNMRALALFMRGQWHIQGGDLKAAGAALAQARNAAQVAAEQPSAVVTVHEMLGKVAQLQGYVATSQGDPRAALQHLLTAQQNYERLGDDGVALRLDLVRDLARAELWVGNFQAAAQRLAPAVAQLQARMGADHPATMDATVVLVQAHLRLGEFALIEPLLKVLRGASGAERQQMVDFADLFEARMLAFRGNAVVVEAVLRRQLNQQLKKSPAPNHISEPLRRVLGEALLQQGRNGEALDVLQEARNNQTTIGHANHRSVATTEVLLGLAQARLGFPQQAQQTWAQAHAILLRELGDKHPSTLAVASYLALGEQRRATVQVRAHLAHRLQREMGWQVGAEPLALLLRQACCVVDWAALPLVF